MIIQNERIFELNLNIKSNELLLIFLHLSVFSKIQESIHENSYILGHSVNATHTHTLMILKTYTREQTHTNKHANTHRQGLEDSQGYIV